jgi:hypothetical protein
MKTKIDREFSNIPGRGRYEEGRDLMGHAASKIADKYHLSVLCMTSSQGHPDHQLHIQNMSVETMANFMVGLLAENKNKDFMRRVVAKVPDRIWIKVLGFRFGLFYMAMGAGLWAAFGLLLSFLRRVTVN